MALDLTSLENAIERFAEGLERFAAAPDDTLLRDGVIQRFAFTYELTHKMLRRYLEMSGPSAETIEQMSFPTLIRTGSEQGLLLSGWDVWTHFRQARTDTSHTYDQDKARKVVARAPAFLDEARFLLGQLKARAG